MNNKTVLYKEFGEIKSTSEDNYNARIQNSFKITTWKDFESFEQVIDYCIRYCKSSKENFIVIE